MEGPPPSLAGVAGNIAEKMEKEIFFRRALQESNHTSENCFELLLTSDRGLDGAPFKYWTF